MITEQTESGKILKFTVKEAFTYAFIIVSVTASAMGIYGRFQSVESDAITEKTLQTEKDAEQDSRIEYVNDRIDRKFKQTNK